MIVRRLRPDNYFCKRQNEGTFIDTRMTEMDQAEAPVSEQTSTSLTDDAGDGSSKGLCIVVLGMAGSGKSSFVRVCWLNAFESMFPCCSFSMFEC